MGSDDIPCLDVPAPGDDSPAPLVVTPLGTHLSRPVLVRFIDAVKEQFGVEPVCHVLSQFVCKIAPSTYYATKARPPSARC